MNDKNRRDDIKIDIISEINDDIIEKNSKRRFELFTKLMARRRKNKKIAITWISVAASLLLVVGIISILIPILGNQEPIVTPSTKQVPVYQGMTVSDEFPSAQSAKADTENLLPAYMPVSLSLTEPTYINPYNLSTGNGKGNANGHDKNGKDKGEVAKDIKDSLKIDGSDRTLYYAEKNQDIFITVHINNPDDFEILSFTLNGDKYSSYMFEEGSDMENLVLKVNVGEADGVIEYTIDAIKYVDGTEIKDVRMEGDKTVKVGVATDKQPTAVISDEKVAFNDISFSISVTDTLKLLELSGGRVDAVLYEGENIIATKSISVAESTSITFDNLKPTTEYTYVIAASYDALDGSGFNTYILAAKTFTTLEALMFNNVTVGQENVSFNLLWDEKYIEREIVSISLYQGEAKIKDIETTASAIDGLVSNKEYTVIVEYKNNGKTDNIYLTFTTKAKTVPTLSVTRSSITQTSVEFGISFTDTDGVGEISKIELLHGSGNIIAPNISVRKFDDLLSNNTYTVKVTYTYDLNDGAGVHTEFKTLDLKTAAKAIPTLKVTDPSKTLTSVGFGIDYRDPDTVGEITKIELLHETQGTVIADNLNIREFTDLLSGNSYSVKVTYVYNLNDGQGAHTEVATLDIKTKYDFGVGEWEPSEGLEITDGVITGIGSCTDTVLFIDKSVGNNAFKYSAAIEQVYIYCDEEAYIGEEAFYGCNNLTNVTIANGITSIGDRSFYYCTSLVSVNIGGSVTSIGRLAFEDCYKLVEVINKSSLEIEAFKGSFIGAYAKEVHTGESKIVNKDGYLFYTYDGVNYLLGYAGKDTELIFPDDFNGETYEVYKYAFSYRENSMSITMSNGVTSIGDYAFYWCQGLKSITIPNSVTSIGKEAFCNSTGLKSITIPNSIKSIGNSAFSNCWSLASVTIPNSVTSIGSRAFSACYSLKSITIPSSVTEMGSSVFESGTTVYVAKGTNTTDWKSGWLGSATVVWL